MVIEYWVMTLVHAWESLVWRRIPKGSYDENKYTMPCPEMSECMRIVGPIPQPVWILFFDRGSAVHVV
jgi:hypothetical protein